MEEADKIFLEYVVKALVDNPDDVKIDRVVDEMGVLISLTVNPEDMGKIIGRMGNTAKAIRTLLRIIGMKNNARVNLKINEPEGSERGSTRESTRPEGGSRDNVSPEEEVKASRPAAERPTGADLKTVDQAMEDLKGI